jgi:hypothetical protein
LNFQKSSLEPGFVCWLVVRYIGSSVTLAAGLGRSGQWSAFGMREPLPVQTLQPIVQPCLRT